MAVRRTFNLAAIISLILCLAALIAWPLSYGWPFKVDWLDDFYGYIWQQRWAVASYEGTIWVRHFLPDFPDYQPRRMDWRGWNFVAGVGYSYMGSSRERMSTVWVQYWFIVSATSLLPLIRFGPPFWRRIHSQRDPLRCSRCGYDLRATPTRCPECGTQRTEITESSIGGVDQRR